MESYVEFFGFYHLMESVTNFRSLKILTLKFIFL